MTDSQKKQIRDLREQGMGYKKIAAAIGISVNSVKSLCRRDAAKPEPVYESEIKCPQCGKVVSQESRKRRFCSPECRTRWWNSHLNLVKRKAFYEFTCKTCGKPFIAYGNADRKYCSRDCYFKERYKL